MRNPAFARVQPVRPEQFSPMVVPQEFFWPPPRAQPLSGPPPSVPPPHTYGRPTVVSPAARPQATASFGAVILCPTAAGSTVGPDGMTTVGPIAATFAPPPVTGPLPLGHEPAATARRLGSPARGPRTG